MEVIPERGDIWWIALDPTLGSEIRKTRSCVAGFRVPMGGSYPPELRPHLTNTERHDLTMRLWLEILSGV